MAEDDRDELLGRLLGMPLDRFVEQRHQLVRELRAGGDRETAAWLAGLRRPAPGIWALDQIARGDPSRLRALFDLGAELRGVQMRAVRGDRDAAAAMRDLGMQVQRSVDDVVRRAAVLLRDAGHGVTTDTTLGMGAILRATMSADDEAIRERLAAGLLLGPVEEEGSVFGFDMTSPPPLRVIEGGAARAQTAAKDAQAEGAQRSQELRRRADEAAQTARRAEREVAELRESADALHVRAAELRAQIRALERELDAAEDAARPADAAVRDAQTRARAARRDADAAEAEAPAD